MNKELKSTDDSFFIMKWGKFVALIGGIVFGTNIGTVFIVESQNADTQSKLHDIEVEEDKAYKEARDKRRLERILKDAEAYSDIKFYELEIRTLKKDLKNCKNEK